MYPPEIYKLFGPISVFATGIAILFMLHKWPGHKGMTISQHAAANKFTFYFMLAVQSVTLPLLFVFLVKWLAPTLGLPTIFSIFSALICGGLLLAAWTPDTHGWQSTLHKFAGYNSATLAIPTLTIIYLSQNISSFARYVTLAVLLYEIAAITTFAAYEKAKNNHLYIQGAYIFLFAFTTLAAAYL